MIGFGEYGKGRKQLGIVSTDDARLVLIDPTSEGFFANVLGYDTEDKNLKDFIEAIKEVKEGVGPFWKPIYDPSLDGAEVVFKAGSTPAVRHSYNFWKRKAEKMPTVQGKKWSVGSEYQYYAFLVWLVNSLEKKGWTIKKALEAVVLLSKDLGHYRDSGDVLYCLESTGSREVCGVYDLANTFKMLSCTNEEAGGFWVAGGVCISHGGSYPLADLIHYNNVDDNFNSCVGWLVLA